MCILLMCLAAPNTRDLRVYEPSTPFDIFFTPAPARTAPHPYSNATATNSTSGGANATISAITNTTFVAFPPPPPAKSTSGAKLSALQLEVPYSGLGAAVYVMARGTLVEISTSAFLGNGYL